ncbi:adenine-specific methyltransferase EcoRI family protein [Atopobiaceae bacterium HCP3S3_F7]
MSDNSSLGAAKSAKNDEFYTQYSDIEAEMNAYYEYDHDVFRGKTVLCPCDDPEWSNFTKYFAANFTRFGLKKLISTSYAKSAGSRQLTLFEQNSPLYDADKHDTHGKVFTLTGDADGSGLVDTDDVLFSGYLEGDGDFRSVEVTALRDEADFIITNPPFSLFRDFLAWIRQGKKRFIIIGNMNAITYKEVFPLLKANEIWVGYKSMNKDMYFDVPDEYKQWLVENKKEGSAYKIVDGVVMGRLASACWFTNVDHGKRHEELQLDTMAHNLKFNKKLKRKFENAYGDASQYPHYDNYAAIEVPFTECIPSDYDDVMGVPITFMDKYNPQQFEIVGTTANGLVPDEIKLPWNKPYNNPFIGSKAVYQRILIRKCLLASNETTR